MTLLLLLLLTLIACGDDETGDTATALPGDSGASITDDTGATDTVDTATPATDSGDTHETGTDTQDSGGEPVDADLDGYAEGDDCDDQDATVHPGATELCDGIDNDCDEGTTEEGLIQRSDGSLEASIQDALDVASPGETITLCPGTYTETLKIERSVILLGRDGAEQTVIDAASPAPKASTIEVTRNATARLEGLTITGGNGTLNDGERWGGGIYAGQSDGIEVVDCIVRGNQADWAAGMIGTGLYPAADVVTGTVFESNQAAWGGGAFILFHATLEGVTSQDNEAGYGGGGSVWYWSVSADPTTLIDGNTASVGGGGLFILDEGTWSGGVISGNTATELGGGVVLSRDAKIKDTTVSGNTTSGVGGGIAVDEDTYGLTRVDLVDNTAGQGGGLAVADGTGTLDTVTFSNSVATDTGGGILLTGRSTLTAVATPLSGSSPDDVTLGQGPSAVSYTTASASDFTCSSVSLTCTW